MRPAGGGGLDHLIVEILERGSDRLAEVVGDIDLVLTGQRADVDLGGGGIGDHVGLVPRMEHVGADGEMGAGVDPSRQTEVVEGQQVDGLGSIRSGSSRSAASSSGGSHASTKRRHSGVIATEEASPPSRAMASASGTRALALP